MEKMKIIFTREGNTLDVWFDDPKKEAYCSETEDEVILKKDKTGHVIGIEILNFLSPRQLKENPQSIPVDVSVQ